MKSKTLSWNNKNDWPMIISLLQSGVVIAGTSDTVVGLYAAVKPESVEALDSLKQRKDKPYLILIGSSDDLHQFIPFPLSSMARCLIEHCWPGPLTLLFKAKIALPRYMITEQGTIALRMPGNEGLCTVAHAVGGLFSTSANRAGVPCVSLLEELDPFIKQGCTALVEGVLSCSTQPSTILDCSESSVRLIRAGAYPLDMIERKTGIKVF
jgi:L-threonylcarbamoyladenylate synthase